MAQGHIAERKERIVVLEVTGSELRALRRGLEHDLGGALDGVRYALHHDLERMEELFDGKVDVPGYGAASAERPQPKCGNTEPHRPHNGFAHEGMGHQPPWCTGVNDEGSGPWEEPVNVGPKRGGLEPGGSCRG